MLHGKMMYFWFRNTIIALTLGHLAGRRIAPRGALKGSPRDFLSMKIIVKLARLWPHSARQYKPSLNHRIIKTFSGGPHMNGYHTKVFWRLARRRNTFGRLAIKYPKRSNNERRGFITSYRTISLQHRVPSYLEQGPSFTRH